MFHALPYEIAHAVVRTLCQHSHSWNLAKQELDRLKETDPEVAKSKTQKAKKAFDKLQACDRFIVMNRRTGFVATKEWLARNVTLDENGKPSAKNSSSKAKPWVLTLRVAMQGASLKKLLLKACDSKDFKEVKCFDLPNGTWKSHLPTITAGYEHLFGADGDEDTPDSLPTWMLQFSFF